MYLLVDFLTMAKIIAQSRLIVQTRQITRSLATTESSVRPDPAWVQVVIALQLGRWFNAGQETFMPTLITRAIPGDVFPANYLVRVTTSFPWANRARSPIQVGYKPGEADRPIGVELQLATPSNTLRLDCDLQPNPFVVVGYKPKIILLRPARCHLLIVAIFKRTALDANDIPLWFYKDSIARFCVAEHMYRQGLVGEFDRRTWANEILPRTSLSVWRVTAQEIDQMKPAAGFAHTTPGGSTLMVKSKNQGQSGFLVGTPNCR